MEYTCSQCPRKCSAERSELTLSGFCRSKALPMVVRAAPHFGEEPCISGARGSGAVFFSGCNLKCVFCQNEEISRSGAKGRMLDAAGLRDLFIKLRDDGVHNINLVTGSHYTTVIADALALAKLDIPVVWNSSAYESVETLRMLDGLVQIYLPDFKYYNQSIAKKYSAAENYPEIAMEAIREMFRQRGKYIMDDNGILLSGLLIRHLILPEPSSEAGENTFNTMDVIDFVAEEFPDSSVLFSLMSQYTPMREFKKFPELNNRVTAETAANMYSYMLKRGIYNGYWQELEASTSEMLPRFDLTGLE